MCPIGHMGLFDWSKRTDITLKEWNALQRTIGQHSAELERLELTWKAYKDEIKKLVQRWEQREYRAAKKEAAQEEEDPVVPEPTRREVADEISERIWTRRNAKRGSA